MTSPSLPSIARSKQVLLALHLYCFYILVQTIIGEIFVLNLAYALKVELVLLSIFLIITFRYLQYTLFEPVFLWLLLMTLFLNSHVFAEFFGVDEFGRIRNFIAFSVPTVVEQRALLNLQLALVSFSVGWIFFEVVGARRSDSRRFAKIPNNSTIQRVGLIGLIACLPQILGHYISVAQYVNNSGYLAYHLGLGPTKSVAVFAAEQAVWFFLAVFLAAVPCKRHFLAVFWIIVVPLLTSRMFSGARGFSMVMILGIFWYWHYVYDKRVRLYIWIPTAFASLLGLLFIGAYRGGGEVDYSQLGYLMINFLDGQGSSVTTLLVGVDNVSHKPLSEFGIQNLLAEFFMQIDKLSVRIYGGVNLTLEESAFKHGYSGYLLSQELRGDLLVTGASLGTSYVTELFLIGREFAQYIGGVLFGFGFHLVYSRVSSSRLWFLAFLILLPQLLYLPRMSIFSIVSANYIPLLILGSILIVGHFSKHSTVVPDSIGADY